MYNMELAQRALVPPHAGEGRGEGNVLFHHLGGDSP